jgi:hypothetical protein
MDDVEPGKITGRRGHGQEGHFRVAPRTGEIIVGGGRGVRGWAIWRAMQAVQVGFSSEMATPQHGQNRSICRGGLQVPLPTDRKGFVCPASQMSTTIEDVLIHFLGNAVTGGSGTQAGIRGKRTSAMGLVRIKKGCHVKCGGDINFVRVHDRVGATNSGGG